jgi:hypothetical protein
MKPKRYSCPYEEWTVDRDAGVFLSPGKEGRTERVVVFTDEPISNGSISATVTPIEGQWNKALNCEFLECALMFRYANEDRFYIAGIGGFGHKFYVGKSLRYGADWDLLGHRGSVYEVPKGKTYELRAEFVGNRLTLYADGAPVVTATDTDYVSGLCGLRANQTRGRFESIDIEKLRTCFVIMPFGPEMEPVHAVIKQTVEEHGMICKRADDSLLSETIIEEVKGRIAIADLVIVDLTGRNANVYYEAGMADALEKKRILLAQSRTDLVFDVQHVRANIYSLEDLKSILSRALVQMLEELRAPARTRSASDRS